MQRFHPSVLGLAAIAAMGGITQGHNEATRGIEAQRAQMAQLKFSPSAPAAQQSGSSQSFAWLRGFARVRPHRHTYRGLPMSCAAGKRVARKLRNRQRNKKQWKAHVR
jgi:hypothetical protein